MAGNDVKDKFIKLANTHFNKEDVFLRFTYKKSSKKRKKLSR